jgi:hypothetical protein
MRLRVQIFKRSTKTVQAQFLLPLEEGSTIGGARKEAEVLYKKIKKAQKGDATKIVRLWVRAPPKWLPDPRLAWLAWLALQLTRCARCRPSDRRGVRAVRWLYRE